MHRCSARARRIPLRAAAMALLCASLWSGVVAARPRTFGWLEWGYVEPVHARIKAKLDTGAKTSSIHADQVETFRRDEREWVRFRVPLASRDDGAGAPRDLFFERPVVCSVLIKEHDREPARRPVVEIDLCLGGVSFTTEVTLADRSRFNYPLLLGRVALAGRAVIDPAQKYLATRRCPRPSPD